jgi:hypothetical protein
MNSETQDVNLHYRVTEVLKEIAEAEKITLGTLISRILTDYAHQHGRKKLKRETMTH